MISAGADFLKIEAEKITKQCKSNHFNRDLQCGTEQEGLAYTHLTQLNFTLEGGRQFSPVVVFVCVFVFVIVIAE